MLYLAASKEISLGSPTGTSNQICSWLLENLALSHSIAGNFTSTFRTPLLVRKLNITGFSFPIGFYLSITRIGTSSQVIQDFTTNNFLSGRSEENIGQAEPTITKERTWPEGPFSRLPPESASCPFLLLRQ